MKQSFYTLPTQRFPRRARIALIADLHAGEPREILAALEKLKPDYILLAGDILEALDGSRDIENEKAFGIFKGCADIAPTFYSTGNHEDGGVHSGSRGWNSLLERPRVYSEENIERITKSGVELLLDSYVLRDGIAFGGLASGIICRKGEPDLNFLERFSELDLPQILICHHPEYYEKYIKRLNIDLIVSGHAHGGQWRFFGRGVYAPGQGLFPKYTSGVYDGRLVVSRGLKKGYIPRFFNPREIVIIDI